MAPLKDRDPQRIGAYRLIGRLGEGGMGQVFLARSDRGRTVAVKLVRAELADQEQFRARFRQEVRAASRVGREWTAPVLDADTEAETPWVATGYIAGPSLQQAVAGGAPLPERTVRILASGLALALESIHAAGIIHRDLKPSNVLLTIDGPRVIDFGIARALDVVTGNTLTRTGEAVGSPGFMSPEQIRGTSLTPASDVFCLGSVLMYAATGRQPFGTPDSGVHAVMYRIAQEEPDLSALPGGLHDLIAGCLAKDPGQRPTPAQLLAQAEGDGEDDRGADDEPWLPGALIARLGRHAVELLEAENPMGSGTDGAGARLAPPDASWAADGPGLHAPPATVSSASAAATLPPSPVPQGPVAGTAPVPVPQGPVAGTAPAAPSPAYGYPYAGGTQANGAETYAPPPPAPAAPAKRRRGAVTALLVTAALVLVGAGAATGYALLNGKDQGAGSTPAKDGGKKGQGSAKSGSLPAAYLGTWETTTGANGANILRLTLTQGTVGDPVLKMTISGSGYQCEFAATLKSAGPPVRLSPSTVVSGPAKSCRPGSSSSLELVNGRLRRVTDGRPPLSYGRMT
ncbi:protein kinase domain-containing protein [Streptomyces sioyaensis]|uniref:serine/threonine-protein kinase n=1 Tax=Streptomyces sioyaensis TaxID=67364 RepID=UPI003D72CE61